MTIRWWKRFDSRKCRWTIGDNWELDERALVVRRGGVELAGVFSQTIEVLGLMFRAEEQLFTAEELFAAVWGQSSRSGYTAVEKELSRARWALGPYSDRLVNVRSRGWKIVKGAPPVVRHELNAAPVAPCFEPCRGAQIPGRDFRLMAPLGAPGSATWLAEHAATQQRRVFRFAADAAGQASLKRLWDQYQRLQSELGTLDGIVRVHDTSNLAQLPYYLETDFAGEDLTTFGARELPAWGLPERVRLCVQIARSLMSAHEASIAHGALWPGNVLVMSGPQGREVRLMDFCAGGPLDLSRAVSRGSPLLYVAPEIYIPGAYPTLSGDIWSLALITQQVLAADFGLPAAHGAEQLIANAHLQDYVRRGLHFIPAGRATAAEFAAWLACWPDAPSEQRRRG
jgi:DNA-binding winged helix-turn-helix (wHTH) protein